MADSLVDLFTDLRESRPHIANATAWHEWVRAMAQTICEFPTAERRWACRVLLADDLVKAMPGLSLPFAYRIIADAIEAVGGPADHDLSQVSWLFGSHG